MIKRMLGFTSLDILVQGANNMENTIDGRTKLLLELILTEFNVSVHASWAEGFVGLTNEGAETPLR